VCAHRNVISPCGRLSQEDWEFEVSMDYIARPNFKKQLKSDRGKEG
jgi:hypothetical protein